MWPRVAKLSNSKLRAYLEIRLTSLRRVASAPLEGAAPEMSANAESAEAVTESPALLLSVRVVCGFLA